MSAADPSRSRPRAFWADARFLLGIVLIVVAVAGVWLVVTAARQTVPALAAARTIVPGEPVLAGDLRVVDVALGPLGDTYLSPGALEPGTVATRTIGEGELVPHSSLGAAGSARTTTVVLRSAGDVPGAVTTGAVVEVWSAPQLERGRFDTPRVLVPTATVLSVSHEDTVMGSAGAMLELVIDRADVAATLAAIADGSSLSIVPAVGAQP